MADTEAPKFTPGPWRVIEIGTATTYIAFGDDSYIAQVFNPKNAALIAAAPDLLAALKFLGETLQDITLDLWMPDALRLDEAILGARVAIARAEGRQP